VTADVRLRWDDDERARLAAAVLPMLVSDKKLSIVEAVRRAQDTVLPADRRRKLPNLGSVPTELRMVLTQRRAAALGESSVVPTEALKAANERAEAAEALAAEIQGQLSAAQAARAEAEVDVSDLRVQIESLRAHIRTLEALPKAPTEMEVLEGLLARVVAGALAKNRELPGIRLEPLKAPPPLADAPVARAVAKHDPNGTPSERPRLPVILVVGCRPDKRPFFESTFKDRARFKWWLDESYKLLDDKAAGSDIAFCLMGNVDHAAVDHCSRYAPTIQRVQSYSQEALKDLIINWLDRRAKAA
jgi:hypothetical protein